MESTGNDAKALFRKCGTCSQTFAFLINRAYQHQDPLHEKALDTLAGGIFREGHQCGMLWGASLATGAEAFRRSENLDEARAMALTASQELVKSFEDQEHTIECREITGVRMNRFSGLLKFMLQTLIQGMDNSKCFRMAEDWAPKAIEVAEHGLSESKLQKPPSLNCASMAAKNLGCTDEESVMVAGFAGGLGLSGKGCGVLAVLVWKLTLDWMRDKPDKQVPMFRFKELSEQIDLFKERFGQDLRCEAICGKRFENAQEHSAFLEEGGCAKLIESLSL